MLSTYKEKILKELEGVPREMMPKIHKIIHHTHRGREYYVQKTAIRSC